MKESLFSFSLLFECFPVFVERSASLEGVIVGGSGCSMII